MYMYVQDFFWALHLIALPVLCIKIKNIETRTAQLFLGKDGELLDSLGIPNCGPGNKIILKSYTYNRMKCTSASCESVHEEQLSSSTSLQLHQNCSFRPTCEALKFPVPKRLRAPPSELHAVTIKYQCIDDQSSVLNMCEKHKMNFSDTLHLTFKYYTQNLKNCECWVNQGAFSLTIMDLRLKSRNKDACSAAKFLINGHHFTCDPESGSYGAVFGELIQDDMPLGAFISLVPNSDTALPEMVWIQLTPEVSSQIDCHGDRISSEDTHNLNTMNTSQGIPTNSVTNGVHTTDNSHPSLTTAGIEMSTTSPLDDNNARFWIVISVLLLLLGLVIGLLVILWRKHVRLKRHIRTQGEPRTDVTPTGNTIYYQPNTVSRHVNTSLLNVSSAASRSSDITVPPDDPAEGTFTRSEKNLVDGTRLRLKKIEKPSRSLSNIKSALELPGQITALQKSQNCLDQIKGTPWKQQMQKHDKSEGKHFSKSIQRSLYQFSPVTTANTPSTSQLDLTSSTSSQSIPSTDDDVNGDLNVVTLAKNTTAYIERDTELQSNERSQLLNDTNAAFSVTERKMLF